MVKPCSHLASTSSLSSVALCLFSAAHKQNHGIELNPFVNARKNVEVNGQFTRNEILNVIDIHPVIV